jgi:cytochrome c553
VAVPPESALTLNTSATEPASTSVTSGEALFGRFCSVCHGAGGTGEAPTIPYLAGQYASYTALELQA